MRQFCLLLILLSSLLTTAAQDINGIWKGKLVMAPGGCFPVYNIELQIKNSGATITGSAYHFSDSANYVRENFQGTYKKDSNLISIQENGIITFRIKEDCVPCVKNYSLSYHRGSQNVAEEQLRGTWTGKATDGKTPCEPGTIVLTRIIRSTFAANLPKTLTERKAELVREIKVDSGNIRLDFYDNGIVDGDTISVYVNDMPTVSRKILSAKPVSTSVRVDQQRPIQEVIMVGENMGTIPPNTALMIINAGDKRYQLYLTSDDKKNAMVRFVYEKPLAKANIP
jgi:hypothetical protein